MALCLVLAVSPCLFGVQDTAIASQLESNAPSAEGAVPSWPRMITGGFSDTNGYVLAAGHGYVGGTYAGTDVVAQFGQGDGRSFPLVVHGAYGVTDQFSLGFGVGIWDYEIDLGFLGSELGTKVYPYLSPKFQLFDSGRVSASLGGRTALDASGDTGVLFGVSPAISVDLGRRAAGHLSLGVHGQTRNIGEADHVFGLGGDMALPFWVEEELRLFGEIRVFELEEDGTEVLMVGLRFLGDNLSSEVGVAHWFRDAFETRPIVSLAYRF